MRKYVLTDTCFWIGLVDNTDQYHHRSVELAELIENSPIAFPFPCMYETISTRLVRNRNRLLLFEQLISSPNITFVDYQDYKDTAIKKVFESNRFTGHSHSLADSVIREMLTDINLKIDYLVTYNEVDFIDICQKRNIQILK